MANTQHLYLLNIENFSIHFEDFALSLPQSVQKRVLIHPLETDKKRIIFSDLLIRKILSKELNVPLDGIKIGVNNFGKPRIEGNLRREFNLSHSDNIIVLVTDTTPVGVDIEHVLPLIDIEMLLTFFSEDERTALLSKNTKDQLDYFYQLWTLKESYIKALGKGLSYILQSFSISIPEGKISLVDIDNKISWYFKQYTFYEQYKCAICAQHQEFPEKPIFIDPYELLD